MNPEVAGKFIKAIFNYDEQNPLKLENPIVELITNNITGLTACEIGGMMSIALYLKSIRKTGLNPEDAQKIGKLVEYTFQDPLDDNSPT